MTRAQKDAVARRAFTEGLDAGASRSLHQAIEWLVERVVALEARHKKRPAPPPWLSAEGAYGWECGYNAATGEHR